jgi:hypothetical protein
MREFSEKFNHRASPPGGVAALARLCPTTRVLSSGGGARGALDDAYESQNDEDD